MQRLVWALRGATSSQSLYSAMSPEDRTLLDAASPGGAAAYQRVQTKSGAKNKFMQVVGDVVGQKIGNKVKVKNPLGSLDSVANNDLQRLIDASVKSAIPNNYSHYTLLAPNVAAMSIGAAPLKPNILIANASSQTYSFNLFTHVAESERATQRVGLPIILPGDIANKDIFDIGPDPTGAPPAGGNSGGKPSTTKPWQQIVREKLDKELPGKSVKDCMVMEFDIKLALVQRAQGAAIKTLLSNTPHLAEELAVYEILTGSHWQSNLPLPTEDLLLNLAATKQGYAYLQQMLASPDSKARAMRNITALNRVGVKYGMGKVGDRLVRGQQIDPGEICLLFTQTEMEKCLIK